MLKSINLFAKLTVLTIISSLCFTCTSQKNAVSTIDTPKKENQSITSLFGHTWKLLAINGVDVDLNSPKEANITINESKQVTGNSGCNSFGGTAIISDVSSISFPNLFSTKMACMNVDETKFFEALNNVTSYSINENKLFLKSTDNKILLTFIRK